MLDKGVKNIVKPLVLFLVFGIALSSFFSFFSNNSGSVGSGYLAYQVLGQIGFGNSVQNNIFATEDSLNAPNGVELDWVNHRLYVADTGNGRVLVYNLNSSDQLLDSTADYVLGQTNLNTFERVCVEPLADDNLCQPQSVALDIDSQTLFVSDAQTNRVLIFDVTTISNGMSASGVLGQSTFTDADNNDNFPTQSSLYSPEGLDFDTVNNRLFVTDRQNDRVVVMNFDPDSYSNGQNFDFVLGRPNFTTGGSCAAVSDSSLCNPYSVSYDSTTEKLFITDNSNNRVLVYDASVAQLSNGDAAINVLGQSNFTNSSSMAGLGFASPKGFNNPNALEIDLDSSRLFVSDQNRRIYVFDISTITDFEDATNVIGQSSFATNECNSTTDASTICNVEISMAFSQDSNILYVPVNGQSRVLGFDLSTIIDGEDATQLIGQSDYTTDYLNNIPPVNGGGFDYPYDVEIDVTNNRLFVLDANNNRVLVFNTDNNGNLTDFQADFVINSEDQQTPDYDCGPTVDTLCYPYGMTLQGNGDRLFIADGSHNRILVFDVSTSNLESNINPSYVIGQVNFDSEVEGTTAYNLSYPYDLEYDDTNEFLYAIDSGNRRLLGYDLSGNNLATGMSATRVLGAPDFNTVGGGISDSLLNNPFDVAVNETTEQLFIADSYNDRVLVFDISSDNFTNGMPADYVIGQTDFDTDGCTDPSINLCTPYGIEVDDQSELLIVSDANSRVLIYDINVTSIVNGLNPSAVIGQSNFDGDLCNQIGSQDGISQSSTCYPGDISINPENGDLFVSDTSNHRVLQYKFVKISNTSFANGESGEVYSQPLTFVNGQGTESAELLSGTLPPGLSVDGDEITGTPTTTGSYTFTLKVSDDNGANGIFTQNQEFTILVDAELIDTDEDGITDVIEDAGPNDGDANNDSVLDSEQLNVTTFVNEVTDNYVTLHTSTSCNEITAADIITTDTDNAFDYPLGLLSFTALCDNPGDSVTVTEYFYDDLDITLLTPRKYNPNTQQYQTITEYTLEEETIGGESAIVLTFDIVDGGALDTDGLVNSVIIDPSGLAENAADSPDTGLGGSYKSN